MRSRALSGFIAATVLVASPLLAGFAGTDVVVPLVGYDRTVSPGTSGSPVTLWLTNRSTTANALITVQLYTDGATTNPTATTKLVLGPGETHTVADPLGSLFGLTSADGVLRLISTTEVLVAIHADADESGSTGATGAGAGFEGMPASFAIAVGQNTNLLGVAETSSQDYRFAAVETAGQAVTFNVSLRTDAGTVVASRSYDLPPHGALEHSVSDLSALPVSLSSGLLKVEVTAGGGSVLAYGMRVSRRSENATGFDMALADSLLVSPFTAVTGLNQLTGNVTLAGSQTITVTTTPLGGGQTGGTITVDTPAYTAGTGLNVASHQFSLTTPYSLPQGCGPNQLPAWSGTGWGCVSPTTYTAGTGLSLAGNQFSVNFGGDGSATTASRSDHDHVGQTWSASSGTILTLQDTDGTAPALKATSSPPMGVSAVPAILGEGDSLGIGVEGVTNPPNSSSPLLGVGLEGLVEGPGANSAIAILGLCPMSATGCVAGAFYGFTEVWGNMGITGTLSKGAGSFKIDDPIDPANKFLYHSFVESPDMMNIYNGNVVTDATGFAVVTMPAWFEALNRDFRYQLTVIGQFAHAIIAKEIEGGSFTIQTDKPHVKVSWQVTGIRQDAYANAHRIPVEEDKPADQRGYYLHPELYGLDNDHSLVRMLREVPPPRAAGGGEPRATGQ